MTSTNNNTPYIIHTIKGRKDLKPRSAPYFRKIEPRCYIGYRKYKDGKNGSWVFRYSTTANPKKRYNVTLGNEDTLSFDEAQREAVKLFSRYRTIGSHGYTVKDAVDAYIIHLEKHNSPRAAKDTRQRLNKHISDELYRTKVADLTTATLKNWRDSYLKSSDDPEVVRKSKDGANRLFTMLRAALNLAYELDIVNDSTAWSKVKAFKAVSKARTYFLTIDEKNQLINEANGAFKDLIQAAILTGARYSELTGAARSHFDEKNGFLYVSGKTGGRDIELSQQSQMFFKKLSENKKPNDYLFTHEDGEPWGTSHQSRPMSKVVKAAKLPSEVVFYSLRHYYISKALLSGMVAQVVADNCGTSTRIIEKHYAKFLKTDRQAMLNKVEL